MALYSSYTDDQLLLSLKDGDTGAFTEIYERYWARLLTYTMRVIRRQPDAEDIIQELFVSIWRRRHTLDVAHSLSNYLYNSARYATLRHIEKDTTYSNYLQRLAGRMSGEETGVEAEIFGRELEGQIDKLIHELPEKMQEVFILSRRHHLSYKEIADRLSISEETVRKQVYKSLQILRNRLGPLPVGLFLFLTGHFF